MNDAEVYAVQSRRLIRRGLGVSLMGLACAVAAVVTKIADFWMAGLGLQLAAAFHGLAGLNARRMAVRLRARRAARVRSLSPQTTEVSR